MVALIVPQHGTQEISDANLYLILEEENERLTTIWNLKEVKIGPMDFQVTKIGIYMSITTEDRLVLLTC